jgi:hypothetical protein
VGLTSGTLGIHGHLALTVVRQDGTIRDRRDGDNVMCTVGLTALAGALVWSGIQDVAASQGVTQATYLSPLWGAVGSGSGTVSPSDTLLFSELGRQQVGAGASSPATPSIPAQVTWLFYFPSPSAPWNVTEAGLFANGSSDGGSVSTAGALIDHWAFSPAITVPTSDTLILEASFAISGA